MTWPHIHRYGVWEIVCEVPLWRKYEAGQGYQYAAIQQPSKLQPYLRPDKTRFVKEEPDVEYVLAGKLIEQKRICTVCKYSQRDFQKVVI